MNLPILETARLRLRPFRRDDFMNMRALDSDAGVVRYLGHGRVREESETQANFDKIFRDYETHGMGLYAAELASTGEFIGRTGLIPWILEGQLTWEIGFTFAQAHWGKGFASEAAKFWSQWGFAKLDVPYFVSLIHPHNEASQHVARKIGMKHWKPVRLGEYSYEAFRLDR